jgi:hypothetical protein
MGQQPAHTTEQKAARTEPPGSCDGMCSKVEARPSGGVFSAFRRAAIPGFVKRFRRIFCLGLPTLGECVGAEEVGGEGESQLRQ